MTAVAIQHREAILDRLQAGKQLKAISRDLGVSPAAISQVLSKDPDYRSAMETGLAVQIETREEELEVAGNALNLARARELLSHARWRAERECPARWGQHQHIEHSGSVSGPSFVVVVAGAPQDAVQQSAVIDVVSTQLEK